MGRMNIMAGVQAAERKKGNIYAGNIDFAGLGSGTLGGLDLNNQSEISRRLGNMDKDLGEKLKGSNTEASWSEVKKLMDDGSQMGLLLMGDQTHRGLAKPGTFYEDLMTRGDKRVQNLASKDPKDWQPDDLKTLKEMGVDPVKLAAEINKNPEAWKRLQGAAQSGKLSRDDIAGYLVMTDRSGLNKVASDLNRQGTDISMRLKSDNFRTAKDQLSKSKNGQDVLAALSGLGSSLEGVTGNNIGKFNDPTGAIAGKLAGMTASDREAAFKIGGEELRSIYNYRQQTKGRLHGGMGVDQVLSAGGISLGDGDADQRFKKDLQGMLHGKGGTLGKGDEEAVLKLLTGQAAGGLRTSKAGVEGNSKYLSEQEVSNNLKALSENNLKATQILADLASGQKVGTTAAGAKS
jgi:hypothetical protein